MAPPTKTFGDRRHSKQWGGQVGISNDEVKGQSGIKKRVSKLTTGCGWIRIRRSKTRSGLKGLM